MALEDELRAELERRISARKEPMALLKSPHPHAFEVAIAACNRVDRDLAEFVEENAPTILAALTERKAPVEVEGLVERLRRAVPVLRSWGMSSTAPLVDEAADTLLAQATELATLKQQLAESTPSPDTEGAAVLDAQAKLTPEYLAMTPLQKWETLTLHGLLGTDEPWIADMRETLRTAQNTGRDEVLEEGGRHETLMREALGTMFDDYQTSEHHHPHHVLVPLRAFLSARAHFDALKSSPPVSTVDEEGLDYVAALKINRQVIETLRAEVDVLEAQVVKAVEPFDDALGEDDEFPDNAVLQLIWGRTRAFLTLGELRALRSLLSKVEEGGGA